MTRDTSDTPTEGRPPGEDAAGDDLLGTTIADRYRIDSLLGRGGMGTVYRACQLQLERDVAIKVISHDIAGSSIMIERFKREAAATARLRHPNIVAVYDFATLEDGRFYLVMELLKGPTLEARLREKGPMSNNEMLGVLRPVCRAIAALHRAEIVHRDLKPSNIVLPDPGDPDDLLKVVDFGIARLRESAQTNLTGAAIIGTPGYLAPEVIEGHPADTRSDIYALGIIAYVMVTARLPFNATTTAAILLQQLTKDPEPPSRLLGARATPLDGAILRAIDRDPDARYQTADELLDAVDAALSGAPSAVVPAPIEVPAVPKLASILLIEDDEDLRLVTKAALVDAGYEVTDAGDGVDALMKIGGANFDLILSDVDMPHLDGFSLLEMLASKKIATPVIFVTGRVDPENEVRGLELGAVDYLRKPVAPPVLLARVKSTLQKRQET
jgi:serine/threonine-protein kinase